MVNSHYLPQSYLRGWRTDKTTKRLSTIYRYKINREDRTLYEKDMSTYGKENNPLLIKDVACIDGYFPDELETELSRNIESSSPLIIRDLEKIILSINNNDFSPLTSFFLDDKRNNLFNFIANMATRVPATRNKFYNHQQRLLNHLLEIKNHSSHPNIRRNYPYSEVPYEESLLPMLESETFINGFLKNADWHWYFILSEKDSSFITSDNPVFSPSHYPDLGFSDLYYILYHSKLIALTKRLAFGFIRLTPNNPPYPQLLFLPESDVNIFNNYVILCAHEEIYSYKKIENIPIM